MTETIQPLLLEDIDESPTQPRTRWGEMEELAAAIRARRGVLDPIVVRLSPAERGRFELVDGARRTRASKMAGLETIDAIVREYDSQAELEMDQIRAAHREPLTPMEESVAFERLESKHGLSITEIAERMSLSPATIANRIQLVKLIPALRALVDVRMPIVAAQLLSQHSHEIQESVSEDIGRMHPAGWISVGDVRRVVDRYVRELASAAFDPMLEGLTAAPACARCPRNTSVIADLFEQVGGLCTLAPCFGEKTDAAWALKVVAAEVRGARVLTPDETIKALDGLKVRPMSGWVDVDTTIDVSDPMTWRELEREIAAGREDGLGFDQAKVAFARVGDAFFELVSAPYVAVFIEKSYPETARRLRGEPDPAVLESKEEKARAKAKALVELQARNRAMAPLVAMLTEPFDVEMATKVMKLVVLMAIEVVGAAVCGEVARRRELALAGEHEREIAPREALTRAASEMDAKALGALLAELLAVRTLTDEHSLGKVADELLGLAGVSRKKLETAVRNEARNVVARPKKGKRSLPVVVDPPEVAP